jgi:glutathione S-transferase
MLGHLDGHLSNRTYIAGDSFTVGDIPMGCAVWRWMSLPIERPAYPALERWFDTLCDRQPYQKVVMKPLT